MKSRFAYWLALKLLVMTMVAFGVAGIAFSVSSGAIDVGEVARKVFHYMLIGGGVWEIFRDAWERAKDDGHDPR